MNIEWIAEERDVRDLGRVVKTGEIVENVPDVLALQFIDQGVAMAARQTASAVAPDSTAPAETDGGSVSVPVMITKKLRRELKDCGFTDEQIDGMTPEQAHAALNEPEPATAAAAT